jgi:hypothetical protein
MLELNITLKDSYYNMDDLPMCIYDGNVGTVVIQWFSIECSMAHGLHWLPYAFAYNQIFY